MEGRNSLVLQSREVERRHKSRKAIIDRFLEVKGHAAKRIEHQQHPDCQAVVVIPVYNETFESVYEIIEDVFQEMQRTFHEAFNRAIEKKGIDDSDYPAGELIKRSEYICHENIEFIVYVNNSSEEAQENTEAYQNNRKVIEAFKEKAELLNILGLAVHVIDGSSEAEAFSAGDHNIGRVRDEMYSIASARFLQNGKPRGLIFAVDADSRLYTGGVNHVMHRFRENPALDALSGRYHQRLDHTDPRAIDMFFFLKVFKVQ